MASEQALATVERNHFSFVQLFSIFISSQVMLSMQTCPLLLWEHIEFRFSSHHRHHGLCLPARKPESRSRKSGMMLGVIECNFIIFKTVPITFIRFHVRPLYNAIYFSIKIVELRI